jgi:hypothetical protein
MRRKSSIRRFWKCRTRTPRWPKPGGEIRAAVLAMAREYEVRHRRQNLEAQFGEGADQRLAFAMMRWRVS